MKVSKNFSLEIDDLVALQEYADNDWKGNLSVAVSELIGSKRSEIAKKKYLEKQRLLEYSALAVNQNQEPA